MLNLGSFRLMCIRCPPEMGLSNNSLNIQEVEEGAEPAGFWNSIGPQDRKAYDCMLQGDTLKKKK